MGKWSNKTCFICGVRRPIFRMKQEIITQKTGHIGFGLSFNPARKKVREFSYPEIDTQKLLNGFVKINKHMENQIIMILLKENDYKN